MSSNEGHIPQIQHEVKYRALRFVLFFVLIYLFIFAIKLMSGGLKNLGEGYVYDFIERLDNPLAGLFAGILATALVQSSSATTSITVGLVAEGVIPVETAIPIIMGANIGTTVTNTIVALGQLRRKAEFEKAFSTAIVHDVFNVLTVLILFPIQVATNFLGKIAKYLAERFESLGGLKMKSPIDLIIKPILDPLMDHIGAYPSIFLGLALLFISLNYIVKNMKVLIKGKIQSSITKTMGNPASSFAAGVALTATVQSSSVTTSLLVPMAGADVITVEEAYPYTLGANIGTTITASIAALSLGVTAAVSIAIAHLIFNIIGTSIWYPLRSVPIRIAKKFGEYARAHSLLIIIYVFTMFIVLPSIVLLIFGVI